MGGRRRVRVAEARVNLVGPIRSGRSGRAVWSGCLVRFGLVLGRSRWAVGLQHTRPTGEVRRSTRRGGSVASTQRMTRGGIAALALLVMLGLLSVAWQIVSAERDRAESIASLGELRSLTSTYVEHVLLERAGLPADPDGIAAELNRVIDAFLEGGDVTLAGAADNVRIVNAASSPIIVSWLNRQQGLVDELLLLGGQIRGTEPDTLAWPMEIGAVRSVATELRGVIADTASQMSSDSKRANDLQLLALLITASLGFGGGVWAVSSARRGGAAGASHRFEALVKRSSDWVLVVDDADRITYSTPAGQSLFGDEFGSLVGIQVSELVRGDARSLAALVDALASCRAGDPAAIANIEILAGGGVRRLALRLTDLRDVAGVAGVVANTRDVTEEAELTDELARLAYEDELTGLSNRAMLVDHIAHALARAAEVGIGPSLIYVDLDDFKIVNDAYGHPYGDELLKQVAQRLTAETGSEDVVARLAGDEFAVLVNPAASVEQVFLLADRIAEAIGQPVVLSTGPVVDVTTSMGIRAWKPGDVSPEVFLRDADVAMYVAKAEGKGKRRVFSTAMHDAVVERHQLAQDLRAAIAEDQLWVALQPQVAVEDGRIVGVEVLARWEHPTDGLISPARFVPLAEDTGLIVDIGRWVLREGVNTVAALDEVPGLEHVRVSVNVSSRQLAVDSFVPEIAALLAQSGINPARLILEITESALQADPDRCIAQLVELRAMGLAISIDDFGTGASSLSRLAGFPLDELKIDRAFIVDAAGGDPRGLAMLRTIAALGRELGLEVVAEGVETLEQLACVRGSGAHLVQGFLYSRPLPFAELAQRWGGGVAAAGWSGRFELS
jgi:diguanylate cyclase (GGDEF)-like protein/PAS domain S-box-containing protein